MSHHLSAFSFEQVARRAKARYVAGLSATVARKDGHHPIIFMQCGPIRHRVNAKAQATARTFEHTVIVRPTSFQAANTADADQRMAFHSLTANWSTMRFEIGASVTMSSRRYATAARHSF